MTNIIHNNDIANIISQIKKDAKKITKKKILLIGYNGFLGKYFLEIFMKNFLMSVQNFQNLVFLKSRFFKIWNFQNLEFPKSSIFKILNFQKPVFSKSGISKIRHFQNTEISKSL